MKMIICKKCGATIDAALGECPNCGAMYYILPEEDSAAPIEKAFPPGNVPAAPVQELDVSRADNNDLFNTGIWKTVPESDETRPFTPVPQPTDQRQQIQREQAIRQQEAQRRQQAARRQQSAPPPEPARREGMSVKTKRLIVAAVALLAVLTLVIALMSQAFNFDNNSNKIQMPNLIGLDIVAATNHLENLGFEVKTQERYDEAAAGTVIAQSQKAEKLLKKGETITLTVSLGPNEGESSTPVEEVIVPNLVGKTYDQASYELAALGLATSPGEPQYSDKDEGIVISQSPSYNTVVNKGDNVLIIISKGPEPSPSPTAFKITVTAGNGGTVTPKGIVSVNEGESAAFTITPNEGYEIREVKVDGKSVGAVTSYTFTEVTSDHALYVVFKIKEADTPTPTPTPPPESPSPSPVLPVE